MAALDERSERYGREARALITLLELEYGDHSEGADIGDLRKRPLSGGVHEHLRQLFEHADFLDPRTVRRFYVELRMWGDMLAAEKGEEPRIKDIGEVSDATKETEQEQSGGRPPRAGARTEGRVPPRRVRIIAGRAGRPRPVPADGLGRRRPRGLPAGAGVGLRRRALQPGSQSGAARPVDGFRRLPPREAWRHTHGGRPAPRG